MRWLVRILLFLVSLLYCSLGGVLVFVGAVYGVSKFSEFSGTLLDIIAVTLISVGGVLVLIGLLGIITSCVNSFSLSYIFSFILLLSIIIQILAAILFVIFRPEVENTITKAMDETYGSYYTQSTFYEKSLHQGWDMMQEHLQCCGGNSYKDWSSTLNGTAVPDSCCTEMKEGCGVLVDWTNPNTVYQIGCIERLWEVAGDHLEIILPSLAGFLVIQILGVCFSCCLARSVQVEDCQVY